jgi:hypothetical protein
MQLRLNNIISKCETISMLQQKKNPVFRNMLMRILVDITKEGMDDTVQTPAGRVVTIFNFIANKVSNKLCRCSFCGASSDHNKCIKFNYP